MKDLIERLRCWFFHHPVFIKFTAYQPENDKYERQNFCFKCNKYR